MPSLRASSRKPPATGADRGPVRRLKLRHVLFVVLLLSGIIPLVISSSVLIIQNRTLLVAQEREYLVRSAALLSRQVSSEIGGLRRDLTHQGEGILAFAGGRPLAERLREPWAEAYLRAFLTANPEVHALRVLDLDGVGPLMTSSELDPEAARVLDTLFEQAKSHREPIYRLVEDAGSRAPWAALAVPVPRGGEPRLVVESLSRLDLSEGVLTGGAEEGVGVLVVGGDGSALWANRVGKELLEVITASGLLADYKASPVSANRPFEAEVAGERRTVEATVSPVAETGWGVLVLKPMTAAMAAVDRMMLNTLLASLLLLLLALLFAAVAARWMGRPIQRLADTTHAIAGGNFGHRVEVGGLGFEMASLADNFNRMSGHVERYVEELKRAASANRELFIGSIRAFAAAIDAKDPYTRGHSERVASVSRAIARHMGFDGEFQQRVWLGALLHDVGKIGVEDSILRKNGRLTDDEFAQMKLHTVIGAEIMGRIEQLKEIVPAIRWHHENWNGRGYPDGIKGERIPLMARIVAVADTFDAITTTRPYQEAFTLDYAVETITKLAGSRFDAKVVTAFLSAFQAGQVVAAIERPPVATAAVRERVAATT